MNNKNEKFPGFPLEPQTNYWRYPKILNGWWHILSGSEQKVLDYIVRHTWGFNKAADKISFSLFEKGIKGYDKGTGLSRRQIIRAVNGLETKDFILVNRKGRINEYRLVVTKCHQDNDKKTPIASDKSKHTIKDITIKKKQYTSSKKKPYFWGKLMWKDKCGKWWIIHGQDDFREFAGKESEIKWK